jgi:hypothetical protein
MPPKSLSAVVDAPKAPFKANSNTRKIAPARLGLSVLTPSCSNDVNIRRHIGLSIVVAVWFRALKIVGDPDPISGDICLAQGKAFFI